MASEFWSTFEAMAPFLLFGFAMAGVLSVLISPATVERHLGGRTAGSVIRAALFGVPLPLCSCSVIPVTASLRRHGAGRGAATAFLLSTPQTGIDSIMVTYALLGPVMAVFRPVAAFITGVIGGLSANALHDDDTQEPAQTTCGESCCSKTATVPHGRLWRACHHGFVALPRDVGRSMLIGVLIAAAISTFVPESLLTKHLGGGLLSMLAMMLFGIPVYVCATASVPIAAVLIAKGVSPGAALVFLMTGPATNAASIAAVWKMMGRHTAIVYLATTAGAALASGLLLDRFLSISEVPIGGHTGGEALPPWMHTTLAFVLIVVLIAPSLPRRRRQKTCCAGSHPEPEP
ncbi:MAG: SO_0444 family Cu/Zn efflux transporter [Planctomycetes bacterium]|nr:SO_0444 family Cu/Zn efflux transporter [Planctomycetota bacterium]